MNSPILFTSYKAFWHACLQECTVYNIESTVHSTQAREHNTNYSAYGTQYRVYSIESTVYSIEAPVDNTKYSVYGVNPTVYRLRVHWLSLGGASVVLLTAELEWEGQPALQNRRAQGAPTKLLQCTISLRTVRHSPVALDCLIENLSRHIVWLCHHFLACTYVLIHACMSNIE